MKAKRRLITNETMDTIIQWVLAHCPCGLEDHKEFVRGLFFITDEAVQGAIEEERERNYAKLKNPCVQ